MAIMQQRHRPDRARGRAAGDNPAVACQCPAPSLAFFANVLCVVTKRIFVSNSVIHM
jgi:hypothetical protein